MATCSETKENVLWQSNVASSNTKHTAIAVTIDDSSSSDDNIQTNGTLHPATHRFPIDHYANQYKINKNTKHRRKQHVHNHNNANQCKNQCKNRQCGENNKSKSNGVRSVETMRRIGKLCNISLPILISLYGYYGFFFIIPNVPFLIIFTSVNNQHHLFLFRSIFGIFCFIIFILTYWSYFKGSYSHPGPIPLTWRQWDGNPMTRPPDPIYSKCKPIQGATMIITKNSKFWCNKCNSFRPRRTGHCSRCDICVTRLDHHCSFMNNCIGSNNHRYFVQFVVYIGLLLTFYILCAIFSRQNIIENTFDNKNYEGTVFIICVVLPTFAFPLLGIDLTLVIAQFQTLIKNETFLEIKFRKEQQPQTSSETPKKSCFANLKKRMKERRQRRLNKNKNKNIAIKNDEEAKGLLNNDVVTNDDDTKNDTKENNEKVENEYNLGSKFGNIQSVLGSSLIYWFIPLDWPQNELRKRMLEKTFSYDLKPCKKRRKKTSNTIDSVNIMH